MVAAVNGTNVTYGAYRINVLKHTYSYTNKKKISCKGI